MAEVTQTCEARIISAAPHASPIVQKSSNSEKVDYAPPDESVSLSEKPRKKTKSERLRTCYYYIINSINVNQSIDSPFPLFHLDYWRRSPRRATCCKHRIKRNVPAVAVFVKPGYVQWVMHYNCFKRTIDINKPKLANRLQVRNDDPDLWALIERDYGQSNPRPNCETKRQIIPDLQPEDVRG